MSVDLDTLTKPLSAADPCGPDLELADDDDYLNAVVSTETVLPPEYFVFSDYIGTRQPYDQDRRYSDLDVRGLIATVSSFIGRTRDLRLYALLAKLYVLAKSLPDAEVCVEAMAVLLDQSWEGVHPGVEAGGEGLRRDVLQRLDDTLVVTALQHVPLFVSKRHGGVTWNRYLTEVRKAGGTGDEVAEFDKVLAEEGQTELSVLLPLRDELAQARTLLIRFAQALRRIQATCAEHMEDGPPRFPTLAPLVDKLRALVDRVYALCEASVVRVDPASALEPLEAPVVDESSAPPDGVAATASPARVTAGLASAGDAAAALAAVAAYFGRAEPSNPALLLIHQAQGLIGKSFMEAMQILLPDHAPKANFEVGVAKTFALPLARLASPSSAAASVDGIAAQTSSAPVATTRGEAVALLDQVSAYFRSAEPSSPIPMLTEGARALTGKDFMTLLSDVLPKDTLKAPAAPK